MTYFPGELLNLSPRQMSLPFQFYFRTFSLEPFGLNRFGTRLLPLFLIRVHGSSGDVDASRAREYHEYASGRSGDRGFALCKVEESPYSVGHDAGESPGWRDLSDWATETGSRASGQSEKVV